MDIQHFTHRLMELVSQFKKGVLRYEQNHFTRGKITLPQLWALEYLSRRDGCPMSELADFLGTSRPAATGLVARLISQGFVARQDVEKDRRKVEVRISTKGRKIVAHIWEQKRRTFVKVFSKISAHDRKQYLKILEQVVKNLV